MFDKYCKFFNKCINNFKIVKLKWNVCCDVYYFNFVVIVLELINLIRVYYI